MDWKTEKRNIRCTKFYVVFFSWDNSNSALWKFLNHFLIYFVIDACSCWRRLLLYCHTIVTLDLKTSSDAFKRQAFVRESNWIFRSSHCCTDKPKGSLTNEFGNSQLQLSPCSFSKCYSLALLSILSTSNNTWLKREFVYSLNCLFMEKWKQIDMVPGCLHFHRRFHARWLMVSLFNSHYIVQSTFTA